MESATIPEWISTMEVGRSPSLPDAYSEHSWYKEIVARLPLFALAPVAGGQEKADRGAVFVWLGLREASASLTAQDLTHVARVHWLLDSDEAKHVEDWTSSIAAKAGESRLVLEPASSAGSAASAGSIGYKATGKTRKAAPGEARFRVTTKSPFNND